MTEFSTLLQQGNAWLFVPSAVLLGALHGLEPGHSKTMMAAFIIAVRGTVMQAVLLGLSATLSHTAVVWLVALSGLYFGQHWNAEESEPYFQVISAVLIVGVASWMIWQTWRLQQAAQAHAHSDHDHNNHHHHTPTQHAHPFVIKSAPLKINSKQQYFQILDTAALAYQDPHELAHANDIRKRFTNREVTTGQIIIFGLTGGLIPCPASITVLLLCLQLKKITLGAALVLCFSIGLALTMVASGVLAAISVKHASKRWSGFGELARKAPYFSGALILAVGVYVGYQGMFTLLHH
jgi:ABC-type nickel/cobalt efflux system permease component RcnA